MKNKTFLDSIRCAFRGMIEAHKSEKNYRYYLIIALIFLIINILNKIDTVWWIGYVITVCGVYSSECINTSIEVLANALTTDIREDIRKVKDIAASAVLFWGFGFFIIEALAIGSIALW